MGKAEVTAFLPPDKFDDAWNSKRTRASFAKFGEVQFLLLFSFDEDKLIETSITLIRSPNIDGALDKLYESYIYLKSIGVEFEKDANNLDQKTFRTLAQRKSFIKAINLWVYKPIKDRHAKPRFVIYLESPAQSNVNEYKAILQIHRS